MKGHYRIEVRRAHNGVKKIYNFNNKLTNGYHRILAAKSVTNNTDSVIDTLWLADGMGQHAPSATGFIGQPVFSMPYTDFIPPANLSAERSEREFLNTFVFRRIIMDAITVGEIGVGTMLGEELVLASLTYVKDLDGNPTTLTLLPGDEITITWTLMISTPPYMTYLNEKSLFDGGNSLFTGGNSEWFSNRIDYEMFAAYPNWQVCGYKRVSDLILARNKIVTNTDWEIGYTRPDNTTGQWVWQVVDFNHNYFNVGLQLLTSETDPNYTPGNRRFIPCFLAPVLYEYGDGHTPGNRINFTLNGHDYFKDYTDKYGLNTTYERKIPNKVGDFQVYQNGSNIKQHSVIVKTLPFVPVTIYRDNKVFEQGLTNIVGNFFFNIDHADDGIAEGYKWHAKVMVPGDQTIKEFTLDYMTFPERPLRLDHVSTDIEGLRIYYNLPPLQVLAKQKLYHNTVTEDEDGTVDLLAGETLVSLGTIRDDTTSFHWFIDEPEVIDKPVFVIYRLVYDDVEIQRVVLEFKKNLPPLLAEDYIPSAPQWKIHTILNEKQPVQEHLIGIVKEVVDLDPSGV